MITEADRQEFPHHTDESIQGIKLIRSLQTETLRCALEQDSEQFKAILVLLGEQTNKSWVTVRIADELYERNAIDEKQYDSIHEKF